MATSLLADALGAVDWKKNVADFVAKTAIVQRVELCNLRLAVWAKELEKCDAGNPALSFVREMQTAGHQVAALLGLALYKPAAASMRTVFESAVYFTFFRSHPIELATLVRAKKYYETKSTILEYHKLHTPKFAERQRALGLLSGIESWYGDISATVHGQIPGVWNTAVALKGISISEPTLHSAVGKFEDCVRWVHYLFLCTVAQDVWDDVDSFAKKQLMKGLSPKIKSAVELDSA